MNKFVKIVKGVEGVCHISEPMEGLKRAILDPLHHALPGVEKKEISSSLPLVGDLGEPSQFRDFLKPRKKRIRRNYALL